MGAAMDATQLLTGDHNRVRGLFARFKEAKESDDTSEMATVAAKIFEDLEAHTTIEEEIFYPAVRQMDEELVEDVEEGIQEHHVVKVLMEEMAGLEPGSDEWVAKMTVLIENVEHHAEEEEDEMFPEVRSAADGDALEQLAARLEARKAELGAPTMAQAIDLTKEQLLDLAREQEIPGRSSMSQEELAATVDAR
jgi:hemerythrin superfamily protein